jgi:hypothetical protein
VVHHTQVNPVVVVACHLLAQQQYRWQSPSGTWVRYVVQAQQSAAALWTMLARSSYKSVYTALVWSAAELDDVLLTANASMPPHTVMGTTANLLRLTNHSPPTSWIQYLPSQEYALPQHLRYAG